MPEARAQEAGGDKTPAADAPRAVVFLEPEGPIKDLTAGISYGILQREIFRQALLIAARDSLGLSTRDGELRELPPAELPDRNRLRVITHFDTRKTTARLTVERGPAANPEVLLEAALPLDGAAQQDPARMPGEADAISRTRFVDVLRKAGFAGRANAVKPDAEVPDATEKLLGQMTFTSQFAALRDLHEAIRTRGESPWLVGALVRGYANLGVLTELDWSPARKVFQARALVYAQRLVSRQPKSAWGYWHLAYAEALAGLHQAALNDSARAAVLGKDAARAEVERPGWARMVEALCRFDPAVLAEEAKDKPHAQPAQLLRFLTIEDHRSVDRTLAAAQAVLEDNPECYRVLNSIADVGGVSNQHQTTLQGYQLFWEKLPERLRGMRALPPSVAKLLDDGAAEPDVLRALAQAGQEDRGPAEPSWTVLARLAQETRFLQVYRRLYFMRYMWSVPVDDFLKEALPLVADHPFLPLIKTFGLHPRRQPAEFRKLLNSLPLDDVDYNEVGMVLAFSHIDQKLELAMQNLFLRHVDNVFHDYQVILRYFSEQDPNKPIVAQLLLGFSPNAPTALAVLIDHNWPLVAGQWAALEKSQHPQVLLALGRRYNALKRSWDAEKVLKRCISLSPDLDTYRALAQVYKDQGKMDRWQETLDTFIAKEPDHGLDHAEVQVEIARYLMERKDSKKALPYAEAAAGTGAEWALVCASDCYAKLGEWNNSEQMIQAASERYADGRYRWFLWCKRFGRGDLAGAEKVVRRHLQQIGGTPRSVPDLSEYAVFQMLSGDSKGALESYARVFEQSAYQSVALFIATLSDEVGDKERRDKMLKEFPNRGAPLKRLAELFADCLARGEKGRLDLEATEAVLKTVPADLQPDTCYFIGKFLQHRGDVDGAAGYLRRCADASTGRSYQIQALAAADLRAGKKAADSPEK